MLKRVVSVFAASAVLASTVSIADTDTTIDFSGNYAETTSPNVFSGTFTGDVVIDTTVGSVVSVSLSDAAATTPACVPGNCFFNAPIQPEIISNFGVLLVNQPSLVGISTLTPAPYSSSYDGIAYTDYGFFNTYSGGDAKCGNLTAGCIITSIQYSVPSSSPLAAPEIDSSSAASAMTILLGCLVVMSGRRGASGIRDNRFRA